MQVLFIIIQPVIGQNRGCFALKGFLIGKLMSREYFTDLGKHLSFKSPRKLRRTYFSKHSPESVDMSLRWLNRVMQDHEARAIDLNGKLIFSFFFPNQSY